MIRDKVFVITGAGIGEATAKLRAEDTAINEFTADPANQSWRLWPRRPECPRPLP